MLLGGGDGGCQGERGRSYSLKTQRCDVAAEPEGRRGAGEAALGQPRWGECPREPGDLAQAGAQRALHHRLQASCVRWANSLPKPVVMKSGTVPGRQTDSLPAPPGAATLAP